MIRTGFEAALEMEAQDPEVRDLMGRWAVAGVRYAAFGSQVAHWAALQLGVDDPAPRGDWDFHVAEPDFDQAVAIAGAEVTRGVVYAPTGDNELIELDADDARAVVGETSVQFMRPRGLAYVGGRAFDTRFTPEAYRASRQYGTTLRIAHPIESRSIYGIRQGTADIGKPDLARDALVIAVQRPGQNRHAALRMHQVGWNTRVREFDAEATRKAADFRSIPVPA